MSYQNDTTRAKVKGLLQQRPDLQPITLDMNPEFRDYLFQIAAGTLMHCKKISSKAAIREASRRGVRFMAYEMTGCLACGEKPEYLGVFDDNSNARLIVYPLCETHTKLNVDQLDALVMEAQRNIYGVH